MDTRIPGHGCACTVRWMALYRGTDSRIIALGGTKARGASGEPCVGLADDRRWMHSCPGTGRSVPCKGCPEGPIWKPSSARLAWPERELGLPRLTIRKPPDRGPQAGQSRPPAAALAARTQRHDQRGRAMSDRSVVAFPAPDEVDAAPQLLVVALTDSTLLTVERALDSAPPIRQCVHLASVQMLANGLRYNSVKFSPHGGTRADTNALSLRHIVGHTIPALHRDRGARHASPFSEPGPCRFSPRRRGSRMRARGCRLALRHDRRPLSARRCRCRDVLQVRVAARVPSASETGLVGLRIDRRPSGPMAEGGLRGARRRPCGSSMGRERP
jgi:hypothetical protein